jgi:hypothetical protein
MSAGVFFATSVAAAAYCQNSLFGKGYPMQIRLKRVALSLSLGGLMLLTACGRPSSATVLPLPPAGAAVAPGADQIMSGLAGALSGTPQPTPAPLAPDLPPGSGRLVYDGDGSRNGIMIVPASGGPAQPAAFDRRHADWVANNDAAWSFDQRAVLVPVGSESTNTYELILAEEDGGGSRSLGAISDFRNFLPGKIIWSRDGSKAALVIQELGNGKLYETKRLVVIDVAGASSTAVVEDINLDEENLAWSPDSTTLAFTTGESHDREPPRTIQTIRWDGADRKTLVKDVYIRSLFWPGDGQILFDGSCDGSAYTAICQLDPASSKYQPLYQTPERQDNLSFLSMSPDEQWLCAQEYRRGTLLLINRRTGAVEMISANKDAYFPFLSTWSPDSKYLAVWGQDGQTYVYEVGAGRPLRPLISEQVLAWLPER